MKMRKEETAPFEILGRTLTQLSNGEINLQQQPPFAVQADFYGST